MGKTNAGGVTRGGGGGEKITQYRFIAPRHLNFILFWFLRTHNTGQMLKQGCEVCMVRASVVKVQVFRRLRER